MSVSSSHADEAAACPVFLNHDFRQLHSDKTINLCENYSGKPLLIVNTASHCGYTKQFGPLESLHQKYKDQGLHIVGFASDDFNQEDKDEAKAAGICYKNYGVTFTMLAPTQGIQVLGGKITATELEL
jgi:glutathione peroxidase